MATRSKSRVKLHGDCIDSNAVQVQDHVFVAGRSKLGAEGDV